MDGFIDPDRFPDEESLVRHLVEQVVLPRLREMLGERAEGAHLHGDAWIIGCRQVDGSELLAERLQRFQQHLESGLSLAYVLAEMTDLRLVRQRESRVQNLTLHYIEVATDPDAVPPVSADDLAAMWARSP